MEGGEKETTGRLTGLLPLLIAVAIPLTVIGVAGATAAVRSALTRPVYGTPPATAGPLMGWDDAHHQVVLVTAASRGTWTWDGSGWVRHPVDQQPPVSDQVETATVWDPASRALIGVVIDPADGSATTWSWAGKSWHQLDDAGSFRIRDPALAYDEKHAQVVLVGVVPGSQQPLVTWVLHGTRWVGMPEANVGGDVPAAALHLAYDRASRRLLLFPSAPPPPPPPPQPCASDVIEPGPRMPPPMPHCFMAQRVPCSVGCTVHPLAWDGSTWSATSMTARAGLVVADPSGDGLLDVVDSRDKQRGVWRWDGRSWSRAAGLPISRDLDEWNAAADPDAQQLVLFGGQVTMRLYPRLVHPSNQTWTFDGHVWAQRSGAPVPTPLPTPSPPPPPPPPTPCPAGPAVLKQLPSSDGSVSVQIQVPSFGHPGFCVADPASLQIEAGAGRLLPVQGNPSSLLETLVVGGESVPEAVWGNWCGQRNRIVMRLKGTGFDVVLPIAKPPPCVSSRAPSSLAVLNTVSES